MTNDDSAGPPKPKTLSTAVISGATGAAGGAVFTFTLLPDVNKVLDQTQTASAWLYTLTFISCIMLLILVTGYVLLQRDTKSRTAPVMWVGLSVFAFLTLAGFFTIIGTNVYAPTARVFPILGSGSDLESLRDDPPLKLTVYLNNDRKKTVPTSKADTITLTDNSTLMLDIDHFDVLKDRYKELRSQRQAGQGILNLLRQACAHVDVGEDVYEQCATVSRTPEE